MFGQRTSAAQSRFHVAAAMNTDETKLNFESERAKLVERIQKADNQV